MATGYNGLIVTAFIENLTLNEDCYWINSRYYFFAGQYDGCDPFLCTPPDFNISCQNDGVNQFHSNLTFLEPLMNKNIVVSVECEFSGQYSLNVNVKGKTIFFLSLFMCQFKFCFHNIAIEVSTVLFDRVILKVFEVDIY